MLARPTRSLLLLLAGLLGTALAAPAAHAQAAGTVTGRVLEADSGRPLPGTTVRLAGTERGTATDAFGRFVLRGVPAGEATLVASFVGYEAAARALVVAAGETTAAELTLRQDETQIGEIVVRAEKFVRNLQDTQTSVGIVTEAELEALPIRDWQDAALLVGNVSTSGSGAFSIRGIPNVGVGGGGATATLYVDGVPQAAFTTSRTIRGAWDVEAVEVFRGPQSTVSGRNALAGAVYIRSAAPSFDYGAAARVRGGSRDALDGAFMVTGPVLDDQLAFRLSGEASEQHTGIDFVNVPSDGDGFDRTTVSVHRNLKGRLLATPTALPGFSALLNYTYAYDRPIPFTGVYGPDFSARENTAPLAYFDESTLHNASLEMSYDLTGALTLTSVTAGVATDYAIDGLTYQTSDPEAVVPVAQRARTDELNLTQELRLNYDTERTQAVVGGYYGFFGFERDRLDRGDVYYVARPLLEANLSPLLPPGTPFPRFEITYTAETFNDDEIRNVALFGEVNREVVADRLTLTAGLRYDRETSDGLTTTAVAMPEVAGSPFGAEIDAQIAALVFSQVNTEGQDLEAAYEALLPKLGATVDLTPDVSLGATVQRGYRAGGAEPQVIGERNVFDPEYTWNYELAFRSRWLGSRLVANANVFYTDWRDQQVRVPIEGSTLLRTENAGESTLYGAEVELRAVPVRGLHVFGSLGLTHTEFDTFVLGGRELAGFAFPGAPGETFALGLHYDRGTGPFGALNVSYVGENHSAVGTIEREDGTLANDPLLRAGDYTVVDAQLGYAFAFGGTRARVSAFARNLFDEAGHELAQFDAFGQPVVQLHAPRVAGLSLRVDV